MLRKLERKQDEVCESGFTRGQGWGGLASVLDPCKLRTPCNGDFFTPDSRGGLVYAG